MTRPLDPTRMRQPHPAHPRKRGRGRPKADPARERRERPELARVWYAANAYQVATEARISAILAAHAAGCSQRAIARQARLSHVRIREIVRAHTLPLKEEETR